MQTHLFFIKDFKFYAMYILNIETATKNCSVTLSKSGVLVGIREIANEGYSHAEVLHVYIQEVLDEFGIKPAALSAVAVSRGPGSYTGLRIGVSAAKGLCFALDIPLLSTDTLLAMANEITIENGVILPMIDARRMEVYSAIYEANRNQIRGIEAQILDENSFNTIDQTIYILGDCQEKVKTVLTDSKFVFVESVKYPSARMMCEMSFKKFQNQEFEDLAYFEPLYLKDFLVLEKTKK